MLVDDGVSAQAFLNAEQRGATAPNGKPSKTIDEAGLHLVGGEPGWSAALGVAYTVTYAFRSTAPSTMPDDTGGFSRFNAAQIAQAELALMAWSDVANIIFTRVGSGTSGEAAFSNSASILLANYAAGAAGAAAFANYPGNPSFSSSSGDVWINSTLSYNRNPVPGNYGALVLVHELGHTIGLSHPGDYNADADVEITYANDAEYYEDSLQYTVMSYFDETNTGADYQDVYAASPLLDDISAAQQEYGVNLATRTGDTIYGFNSTAERQWYLATSASTKLIFAVWDAGGIDTFDFSGFGVAQTIDLREGDFSNVGGLVGNVAVAKGAAIENAIGGGGADAIIGNSLANLLNGGGGDDMLAGGAGNDTLYGGAGVDTAVFDYGFGQASATLSGPALMIQQVGGAGGLDALRSIEILKFTDGAIQLADGDGLVDDLAYYTANRDVYRAGLDAEAHYNTYGWKEGRDPDAQFTTTGYLAANADVRMAGINPLDHYRTYGFKEGRDPSAGFDSEQYLAMNADVAAAGINPLEHYLNYGRAEGRLAYAAVGRSVVGGFDAEFYLLANNDVARAGVDPLTHYLNYGFKEGRDPDAYFDTSYYLEHNADVAAAGIDPLAHYWQYGWKEGRDPSAHFDTSAYLAVNGDVAAAGMDPLEHYLEYGRLEGRVVHDAGWVI
jgi:serralysin